MTNTDIKLSISGLELSRSYFENCACELFNHELGAYMDKISIGLVGEGSECFGFDDQLSTDHDYGPSFCIWMSKDLFEDIGFFAQGLYSVLPKEYMGFSFKVHRETASDRRGVLLTEQFYQKFLGSNVYPDKPIDWLSIPEHYLAVATNGELFNNSCTDFTEIRKHLINFYPEDVRLKKIGANLVRMAHEGQVNFNRMAMRNDAVACRLALDQFIESSIKTLYLLDRKYCPYYKWMWRGLSKITDSLDIASKIKAISLENPSNIKNISDRIEEIASLIIKLLHCQNLSQTNDCYLESHALSVISAINDPQLLMLPILMG